MTDVGFHFVIVRGGGVVIFFGKSGVIAMTRRAIQRVAKPRVYQFGYIFTNDKQDDVKMLRLLHLLSTCMRPNKIILMFYFCTIAVKLQLFRSFCTSFYYCYLWTGYKKITFNKLHVAFNNAYQRILDLPWRCTASGMHATYGIYNLEATLRKQTFRFIGRLCKSCNKILQTLENAWII